MVTTIITLLHNQPVCGSFAENSDEELEHEAIGILTNIRRDTNQAWDLPRGLFKPAVVLLDFESKSTNNIKLNVKDEDQLCSLLDITIQFSRDIGMQLGLEKCRMKTIVQGKHTDNEGYSHNNIQIVDMNLDDVHKYLGILQATTPAVATMKSKLLGEFEKRLDLVLKTQLLGKNQIMEINTIAKHNRDVEKLRITIPRHQDRRGV